MHAIILQVTTTGIPVDPAWVVTTISTVVCTLAGTIAFLYRGQVGVYRDRITWLEAELTRKDQKIDQLIAQVGRLAEAADHSITSAEKGRAGYR